MRRALLLLAQVVVLLAGPAGATARAAAPPASTPLLTGLSAPMRLAGPAAGALVVDAATGAPVYSLRERTGRVPASVEKLWTTAAALRRLGPESVFPTRVLARGTLSDGTLRGNLYLRGGGDPALGLYGMRRLAADVRALGVRRVTGAVVGDEGLLDALRGVPSSSFGFSSDVEPLSALTYRRNVAGGRYVRRPALGAAAALTSLLRAGGVAVSGQAKEGASPVGTRELARLGGLPLGTLAAQINAPSDNFYAETLIKDLGALRGAGGTTAAGAAVVRGEAARLGVGPRIVDGSGLSRRNRSSPRQVVTLLRAMRAQAAFRASLALAGRTGTIATRMRRTPAAGRCRAKTGSLRDVSALAGYCRTLAGRTLAFAILMNGVRPAFARRLQDRMAVAMVRYG